MDIKIPNLSLVVLIGPSGAGKSSFARKHFRPTEVLSSDFCRGLVSDDENDQKATTDAFEVLHFVARKRLAAGKLTVVDATNVQPEARKPLVQLARDYHCIPAAIVFNLPEKVCQAHNAQRADRNFGPHVIRQQTTQLRRSLRGLQREGFRHVFVLDSVAAVDAATMQRVPLWNDKSDEHGPFDIIGDVHGCCDELELLLHNLGYAVLENQPDDPVWGNKTYEHPAGRKAVFLGDIVDRGPRILDTLRLVRNMVMTGTAHCVPGNHDMKLMRKLSGRDVQITHGLQDSLAQFEAIPAEMREAFVKEAVGFLDSLVSHYVFDGGKLVVAHAGMKQEMQGRGSGKVRDFALYGETTGETDEFGLPVRYNWAAEYRGNASVVYGHTPVPEPEWLNRTVNIDTGCVFGGKLTALRYPEREFVSVPAAHTYCTPAKPFIPEETQAPALTTQQIHDDLLDAEDVLGKRIVTTRLHSTVTVREENATAALEIMSRYAANPKWLIYLPPTMSPSETSKAEGYLEYPVEAFAHFRSVGVPKVVCEQKHMGSRAVVIVCRDENAVSKRFGILNDGIGIVYTRTGRRFFEDQSMEQQVLSLVRQAMDRIGFWDEFGTEWACLDCELMPWSAKAQQLLQTQYAAVGAAARASFKEAVLCLERTAARSDVVKSFEVPANSSVKAADVDAILSRSKTRAEMIEQYIAAYRQYCWPVKSVADFKLAPFHLLATEGKVHIDRDHVWHMETLKRLCGGDSGLLLATPYKVVDLIDPQSQAEATAWWEDLTSKGGEGMAVKPLDFVTKGKRGLVQPAVKVRGPEYLRIIYGPEYTAPDNLERLRSRNLGAKRSLALREFALGIESLERFVRKEPLRRVHECVFGVLALESEPVDPRL
ncbi:MAG: polynucleotide kinase-phosphatase [bacterium]